MKKYLFRIAAILALIIGAMAIFAGGQVLLGKDPGYYVIDWLPVYNFILGVLSASVVALLIWKRSPYAASGGCCNAGSACPRNDRASRRV